MSGTNRNLGEGTMIEEAKNANEVTPDGAVEIREEDLDQAAGGVESWSQPAESATQDVYKIEPGKADIKVFTPDPSIGLLSEPQKKI